MKGYAWLFAFVLALNLVGFGCGNKGGAAITGGSKAFDSNPAAKEMYQKTLTTLGTNDFVGASLFLRTVRTMPDLTPEQIEVLNGVGLTLNTKMRAAADKGDANAKQALDELRKLQQR
jgi:hypothetical protein